MRSILDPLLSNEDLLALTRDKRVNWEAFFAYAGDTLTIPNLYVNLRDRGLTEHLPEDASAALSMVYEANFQRNQRLLAAFWRLVTILNAVDVVPLPLKGTGLLLDSTYKDIGERVVGDIDLLIEALDLPKILDALRLHGYVQQCNPFEQQSLSTDLNFDTIDPNDFRNGQLQFDHHVPVIKEGYDAIICIELHVRVCIDSQGTGSHLNSMVREQASVQRTSKGSFMEASNDFKLLHTLFHSYMQDDILRRGVVDFRHLLDAQRLLRSCMKLQTVEELIELAKGIEFENEFRFFLWQSNDALGAGMEEPLFQQCEVRQLIQDYKAVSMNRWRQSARAIQIRAEQSASRLMMSGMLRRAYGPMPVYQALPKYLRYAGRKLLSVLT